MPKGHLWDTGLTNYILKVHSTDDLLGHPHAGRIWESFIIEELIKGFHNHLIPADFYYYRTHNQAEIDLVVDATFGTLPIEIKLGTITHPAHLDTLRRFVEEEKTPLGIIVNNGESICWLADKVLQLPATFL